MTRIKMKVNGKIFNLELEDGFANYLKGDLVKLGLNRDTSTIKDLVSAYIGKSLEIYEFSQKLQALNQKLS
jgi:hypothetical protein